MAVKKNTSSRPIDMTSFEFVTACGSCHPGGGPLEYDRDGHRYDAHMRQAGMAPGGDNALDGDYFKARWSQTGVVEADCLLCHQPAYDYKGRNKQLGDLNFRWAATAGSGLASVKGSVKEGTPVTVAYDPGKFDEEGKLSLHIVREPRSETCLKCHAKPQWKKRGASFSARTDVHVRAGLRCVDCHPAGSRAPDARIRGKDAHQIGKGDDPAGNVRNDLDGTARDCASCHTNGYRGAPIARHRGLPPLHLEKLSCQACHIPERYVKAAMVQVSDVFNPGPKITPPAKHIWTFYDAGRSYWNHYGELEMFGQADQPTDPYRPVLIRYKGRIFPANRVHSAWPGLQTEGRPELDHPTMKDVFMMWKTHRDDPAKYPLLAKITDADADGVPDVNRPEEIDALIASVTAYLQDTKFDMGGRKVVWVNNDRVYTSGTEWTALPKHDYEASPYASVYKYSHDVAPARAALGAGGCGDCHSRGSGFFAAPVTTYPFGPDGNPVTVSQGTLLGLSATGVSLSAWREGWLKRVAPWLFGLTLALALLHYVTYGPRRAPASPGDPDVERFNRPTRWAHLLVMASFALLGATGLCFLLGESDPLGPGARALHGGIGFLFAGGVVAILLAWLKDARFAPGDGQWLARLGGYFGAGEPLPAGKFNAGQKLFFWFVLVCGLALTVTGVAMRLGQASAGTGLQAAYTLHDLFAVLLLLGWIGHLYLAVVVNPGALRSVLEGRVSLSWARHHHPLWVKAAPREQGND